MQLRRGLKLAVLVIPCVKEWYARDYFPRTIRWQHFGNALGEKWAHEDLGNFKDVWQANKNKKGICTQMRVSFVIPRLSSLPLYLRTL